MKPGIFLVITAALAYAAGTPIAFAQNVAPQQPSQSAESHRGMPDPDETDLRHDGKITEAQYLAHAKARFEKMDANHDGVVTRDEMQAYRQARLHERMMKMFDRVDADHDGTISRDEFEAAMRRMHDMHARMHGEHGMHDPQQLPPPAR
jgi:Ca2+-binding EF-hand superfamily protein